MYKVEVEDIDNKIKLIEKSKRDGFLSVFMVFNGLLALGLAWNSSNDTLMMMFFAFLFLQAFALYYYIHPLLGKISLLEQDIQNLKAATNTKDEQHY